MDSYSWRGTMLAVYAASGVISGFVCLPQVSFAQTAIAPDTTLPANTVVNFNSANRTYTITGGTQVGTNQFHSFQDFSVPTSNTAHFDNALTTANVIGRVTGYNISDIDGTLRTNGTTNLYLINPNGIIFGANAKLDIAGSFSASTANSIKFSDGSEFSATNPQAPPLLQVNVPLGLQYNTPTPKPVSNAGNLTVGGDLTLSGSSVTSTGTLNALQGNLQLDAVAGNVNVSQFQAGAATLTATQGVLLENGKFQTTGDLRILAKDTVVLQDSVAKSLNLQVGGDLLVQGDRDITVNTLANSDSSLWVGKNVLLRSDNPIAIDAHWNAGGNLRVEKLNGSLGDLYSPNDPIFQFSGDVSFDNYTGASLQILAGGSVTATGTIFINAGAGTDFNNSTVILSDGSSLSIDGSTPFAVDIRAGVTTFFPTPTVISASFPTPISNFSTSTANLTSANISIGSILFDDTETGANGLVFLTNQVAPNNALAGNISVGEINTASTLGSAGSVVIDSKGDISLLNPIYAYSENINGGEVNLLANKDITVAGIYTISNSVNYSIGGNISLLSRNGNIDTTQGDIFSYSYNYDAGKVTLKAGQDVRVGNISTEGGGVANDIDIEANSVFVADSAILTSSAYGLGDSGNITISASDAISFGRLSITSTELANTGIGNAGNISINANSVSLSTGTGLSSSTLGYGNAGNLTIKASGSVLFDIVAIALSEVGATGIGNGGNVSIDAGYLSLANSSKLSSSTFGNGNAGNIDIKSTGAVSFNFSSALSDVGSDSNTKAIGNSGTVSIDAGSLSLNRSILSSIVYGQGNAGDVKITAINSVSLNNGSLILTQNNSKVGNSGNISINTGSLSLKDSSTLSSIVYGQGNAGNIDVKAVDSASFVNGSRLFSNTATTIGAVGNAGNISIDAGSVFITDSAKLSSSLFGQGNAGNITIKAIDQVSFARESLAFSNVGDNAVGNGGNIIIDAGSVFITDGAALSSSLFGQGNAGNITIKAIDQVSFARDSSASTNVSTDAVGSSGNITINANSISVTDRSVLFSSSFGQGNAGDVSITATDQILFARNSNVYSTLNNKFGTVISNSGKINISANSIFFTDDSGLSTDTNGYGNAGNITIKAIDSVSFAKNSVAFSNVGTNAVGNAGEVSIKANSVYVEDTSKLSSSTFGIGNAGNITINANDKIAFLNGYASTHVSDNAVGNAGTVSLKAYSISLANMSALSSGTLGTGNAGNIIIKATDSLSITGGMGLSSNTLGKGNAGNIEITADSIFLSGSLILSETQSNFGNGGKIGIFAQVLDIANGGKISTSTSSTGNAGSIDILLNRALTLDGKDTRISSRTAQNSSGNGGSIFIDPPFISITNGAGISVESLGTGNGGNIDIFASKFFFANNAFINANTASGEGGNINLQIADIFFPRNHSQITATAGNNGNGGNINLSALFLVSVPSENNDIFANAFFGKGGNINITTQAIFGFQYRPRLTPLSDITASSEYGVQGIVNLNTLDTDPSKGLNNLPVDVSDPSRLVTQRCIADQRGSEFIITGKGGVPANPSDRPTDTGVLDNFGVLPDRNNTTNLTSSTTLQPTTTLDAIIEATGWIVNAQNQVVLVAGTTPAQPTIRCPR